jgi:hypothetical protein
MKGLGKLFIIAVLCLLVFVPLSYGANTVTKIYPAGSKASKHDWYQWYTMAFDGTGVQCVDSSTSSRIFVFVSKTGTVVYDVEGAIDSTPDETSESIDLANGSDLSAGFIQTYTQLVPWFCVRLSTCTTCTLTVTVLTGTGR